MTRTLIDMPPDLLRYISVDWDIDWRSQRLGEFTDGVTRTAFTGVPRWIGTPKSYLDRSRLGRWRATRAVAAGGWGIYRIRMVDLGVAPMAGAGITPAIAAQGRAWSTGEYFSTGKGWEAVVTATAAASYPVGATEVQIDTTPSGSVEPVVGQIMSHDDWPFMVVSLRNRGGALWDLQIAPGLRGAITAGDIVMMQGVGRFQAMDSGMGEVGYDRQMRTRTQLQFMEVLAR